MDDEQAGPPEPAREDTLLGDAQRIVADLESELAAAARALERLEAGSYGCCQVCGTDLGERLLAEDPLAERCLAHPA